MYVQVHEQHAVPHARHLRDGGRTPDADEILVRKPRSPPPTCDDRFSTPDLTRLIGVLQLSFEQGEPRGGAYDYGR